MALALLAVGLVLGLFAGHETAGVLYQLAQTPSTHPDYLRTTLTSGSGMYVNDYEEYGLQLMSPEPRPTLEAQSISRKTFRFSLPKITPRHCQLGARRPEAQGLA